MHIARGRAEERVKTRIAGGVLSFLFGGLEVARDGTWKQAGANTLSVTNQ